MRRIGIVVALAALSLVGCAGTGNAPLPDGTVVEYKLSPRWTPGPAKNRWTWGCLEAVANASTTDNGERSFTTDAASAGT